MEGLRDGWMDGGVLICEAGGRGGGSGGFRENRGTMFVGGGSNCQMALGKNRPLSIICVC